jgi:hypothetical protein
MEKFLEVEQSTNFVVGATYHFFVQELSGKVITHEVVRFIGFAPCPATVIVEDNEKRRMYIPRTSLYELPGSKQIINLPDCR